MAIISNGTTIADAGAFSASLGSMVLIKTITVSSPVNAVSFVDGADSVVLDSTYPIYKFEFINIHSANNDVLFSVGFRDGGSNYDATKTTSLFQAEHDEDDGATVFTYASGDDLAQETGFQVMTRNMGNGNDECMSGDLMLFNPSSTTFVKHFIAVGTHMHDNIAVLNDYVSGYCNTTTAVTEVVFSMQSGNIDAGTVTLYGIN